MSNNRSNRGGRGNPQAQRAREKHDRQNNGPRRDFNDRSGADDSFEMSMSPAQILRTLEKRLPPFGATSFQMGRETYSATDNQKKMVRLINNKDVVLVNGPAGTGKTFWTCLTALQGLVTQKYDRICLTAPAVEADENLGFRKGTKDEKMEAFVSQLLEVLDELVGKDTRVAMIQNGMVEIAPHADNRGRTFKHTIYILDESQNASGRQLLTAMGRLGHRSTFVFMGDDKQNDRTAGQSAYVAFVQRFTKPEYAAEIGEVRMGAEDVRRHPLLKKIIENGDDAPLEGFEDRKDSKIGQVQPEGFPSLKPRP